MSRERDVRDHTTNQVTPERIGELHALAAEVSDRLPGAQRIRIVRRQQPEPRRDLALVSEEGGEPPMQAVGNAAGEQRRQPAHR